MNLSELEAVARAATQGEWKLWTSNSWRRFCDERGLSVCEPVTYSERDRHPDLYFRNGGADGPDAMFIQTFSPARVQRLLSVVQAAQRAMDPDAPWSDYEAALLALRESLAALEAAEAMQKGQR